MQGAHIRCYLDGKLIHDVEDRGPSPIAAVAGRVEKTGEIVVKVVNASETPRETQIDLAGVGALQATGQAFVLTSPNENDENTLAQPTKVAPVAVSVTGVAPKFTYTFPAHSLTILRLKPR